MLKIAITTLLLAALCFGLAVSEAFAQQPPTDLEIRTAAHEQERVAHMIQLSNRATAMAAELASLQEKLRAVEKKCKSEEVAK